MPRRKPEIKKPAHRPQIPIDWNVVDKYLEADCPGTEIAGLLGCSPDTLYLRCVDEKGMTFTAYSAQKKAKGDAHLRAKQFSAAMQGDKSMLIWLGKNRLGQKEKTEVEHSGDMNYQVVHYGEGKPKPWKKEEPKNTAI